jgi:hypothetical protein
MSGNPKSDVFATEALASVAPKASEILYPIAIANRSALCAEIAVRLRYIADDLSCLELYRLPLETQTLSLEVLQDLLVICNVRHFWKQVNSRLIRWIKQWSKSSASRIPMLPNVLPPSELRNALVHLFERKKSKEKVQDSIARFCIEKLNTIIPFHKRVVKLSTELTGTQDWHNATTTVGASTANGPPDRDIYPNAVHRLLLDGIRDYALCVHPHDGSRKHKLLKENSWHLTRLCLGSGFRSKDQLALFNIVSSTSQMAYWQECAISIPMYVYGASQPFTMLSDTIAITYYFASLFTFEFMSSAKFVFLFQH